MDALVPIPYRVASPLVIACFHQNNVSTTLIEPLPRTRFQEWSKRLESHIHLHFVGRVKNIHLHILQNHIKDLIYKTGI